MKIKEFYNNLAEIYPSSLSCSWDNDGEMCVPDGEREVKKVLVSLDATMEALKYAKENSFDVLLTHHPMIFSPLERITEGNPVANRVAFAIKNDISVLSFHTRLDAGVGGVNDTLAELLGLENVRAFGSPEDPQLGRMGDIKVSSPEELAERIKKATGAEKITAYVAREIKKVAVVGGGSGDFALWALKEGADTLITGECSYNKALDAKETGINIFAAGHYFTEMPVCKVLKNLAENIAGAKAEIFAEHPKKIY